LPALIKASLRNQIGLFLVLPETDHARRSQTVGTSGNEVLV
jgi:hypothetical protein